LYYRGNFTIPSDDKGVNTAAQTIGGKQVNTVNDTDFDNGYAFLSELLGISWRTSEPIHCPI